MFGAAKQMLIVVAALLLSAGHAACACLSVAESHAPIVQASAGAAEHGHHHNSADANSADANTANSGNGADGNLPSPDDHSTECDHCKSVAVASDGTMAAGSLPALHKTIAIQSTPAFVAAPGDQAGALARRFHWAAPPRKTPVSLKIRMRD